MMHYAQPPPTTAPTVLEITTVDHSTIRSLIARHEPHRRPRFCKVDEATLRVTFPHGFDTNNQAVLRQLIHELHDAGATNIQISR